MIKKIYIGADHGGFQSKEKLKNFLESKSIVCEDKGAFEYNANDDYPDFALAVAKGVSNDLDSKGIIICRSSIGVMITANKIKGILASNPRTVKEAIEDIQHHGSNILCLSADNMYQDEIENVVTAWLQTEYQGGRHERRIQKIREIEKLGI